MSLPKTRAPKPERDPLAGYLENTDTLDTRRFMIAIKRLADSLSHGMDHSRFLGSGIEYVQSRPYIPGDPVRAIDWRVTARTGKYYVKDFEAPKQMPAWILLDSSASMAVSSTAQSKYSLAVHIAGGLALACLDRVSPVGLLGAGERDVRIEPSLSKHQVMQWLVKLRSFRYDEDTSLGEKVTQLHTSMKTRSLVIVLSDLHDESAVDALSLMAQVHDVAVVQLLDPAEDCMRGAGFMRAQEAETGHAFVTHGRRQHMDYRHVERELRKRGIDHLVLRTDHPCSQEIRHFFEARGLTSGGGR